MYKTKKYSNTFFCVFNFTGFPLLITLSRVIMYMKDSGIMKKLNDEFIFNVTILEKIRENAMNDIPLQIVLTYSHVEGAFSLAIVGLSISCIIFIGEIMFFQFKKIVSHKYIYSLVALRQINR